MHTPDTAWWAWRLLFPASDVDPRPTFSAGDPGPIDSHFGEHMHEPKEKGE